MFITSICSTESDCQLLDILKNHIAQELSYLFNQQFTNYPVVVVQTLEANLSLWEAGFISQVTVSVPHNQQSMIPQGPARHELLPTDLV